MAITWGRVKMSWSLKRRWSPSRQTGVPGAADLSSCPYSASCLEEVFSEVRSAGVTVLWAGLRPLAGSKDGAGRSRPSTPPPTTTITAPTSTVGGVLWGPIVAAYTRPKGYINTAAAAQRAPAHLGSVPHRHSQEHVAHEQEQDDQQGGRREGGVCKRGGHLGDTLYARQVGLPLLGRGEGRNPYRRQEQGASQNGDDHSHQPQASGASVGE